MDGAKRAKAKVIPFITDDDQTKPLPYKRALIQIRRFWREGNVTWRVHADERRKERNITTPEIERVLLEGNIVEHGRSEGFWKYTVEDRERTLKVSVSIRRKLLFIISAMRKNWNG